MEGLATALHKHAAVAPDADDACSSSTPLPTERVRLPILPSAVHRQKEGPQKEVTVHVIPPPPALELVDAGLPSTEGASNRCRASVIDWEAVGVKRRAPFPNTCLPNTQGLGIG